MNNLHDIAKAGEFCLQEAILGALEQHPGKGRSAREIKGTLHLSGDGCEKMIESHLHRLKYAGKVCTTRGSNFVWCLTAAEREQRHG